MSTRVSSLILTTLLFLGTGIVRAPACIHAPVGYREVVSEGTKQALLFFDGEFAHLVIATSLESSGMLPPTMAWVIPLPTVPARYSEASPGLFEELYNHTPSPPTTSAAGAMGSSSGSGILVHTAQQVGAYRVQPIEIMRPDSGKDLNAWLVDNGFHSVPVQSQRYYLRPGACFLAVKVGGLTGSQSSLNPLHIIYRADRLTLPLKFSTHSGVFNVLLYTFTPHELAPDMLAAYRLTNGASVPLDWPWQAPELWKTTGGRRGFLTRFSGEGFNQEGAEVAKLSEDPWIEAQPVELRSLAPLYVAGVTIVLLILGLIVRSILARRPRPIPPERQQIEITRNEEYVASAPPEEKLEEDDDIWISLRRPGDDE